LYSLICCTLLFLDVPSLVQEVRKPIQVYGESIICEGRAAAGLGLLSSFGCAVKAMLGTSSGQLAGDVCVAGESEVPGQA